MSNNNHWTICLCQFGDHHLTDGAVYKREWKDDKKNGQGCLNLAVPE